ncbi:unnamed protein product, partial [Iphiclides podalirius]
MYSFKIFIVSFIVVQCSVCLAKVSPDYIKPCVGLKSDCLMKNFQETLPLFVKGIPSIGVNSTDPLTYSDIKMDLPGGLKLEFTDGVLTGLRKCIVDNVKFEGIEANIEIHCNLTIKGKYKAQGKVLIVSINGDGDAKLKISDMVLKGKLTFSDVVRDGVTYYDVKSYKVAYNIRDRVHFSLTNIFKGNPQLSETVLTFLNENWKDVVNEFGGPLIDLVINIGFGNVKHFFSKVPKDELFVL